MMRLGFIFVAGLSLVSGAPSVGAQALTCIRAPDSASEAERAIIENQCRILQVLSEDQAAIATTREEDAELAYWHPLTTTYPELGTTTDNSESYEGLLAQGFDPCGNYGMCLPYPLTPPGINPCAEGGDLSMCLDSIVETLEATCGEGCELFADTDVMLLPDELRSITQGNWGETETTALRTFLVENPYLVAVGESGFSLMMPGLPGLVLD